MGGEIFVIDVTEANRLLDEQRRVIREVARRCLLKGRNCQCSDCPLLNACKNTEQIQQYAEEVISYAVQR
jgi:hypothetical protein